MTSALVYIVFYSGRPMNFQTITELSGVDPTLIEAKGEPRINRITGDIVRMNKHNSFECRLPVSHGKIVQRRITDTYSLPVLHMDKKFISFLADLNNAEVDFDMYTEPWDKEGDDYKEPALFLPSGGSLYKI